MVAYRQRFDYKFVLMAGDNIYEGPATEEDYRLKFEEPYKPLLDAGVKFYAALGNHDDTNQIFYKPFNMDGHRYYTFVPPVDPITRWDTRVRFFALDSTYLTLRADSVVREGSDRITRGVEDRVPASSALHVGPLRARGARHSPRARIGVRQRRRRRRLLRARAHLRARRAAAAASCISSPAAPARCAPATRRRRRRSRAATTRTITSCWRRSPTRDSSFRRSIAWA